jgi:hypothetical protein
MEVCQGGELFDRIVERGKYTEKDAAESIRTIVKVQLPEQQRVLRQHVVYCAVQCAVVCCAGQHVGKQPSAAHLDAEAIVHPHLHPELRLGSAASYARCTYAPVVQLGQNLPPVSCAAVP